MGAVNSTRNASLPESVPAWLLDYHDLDLAALSRKLVHTLPARLGYRVGSLYLHDACAGTLNLADATQERELDFSVRCNGTALGLMTWVAGRGVVLQTPNARAAALEHGLPQLDHPYREGACLIAPLTCDGTLVGVLNLTGAATSPAPTDLPLEAIFAFLAKAVQHARSYERARTEARVDGLTGLFNQRWMAEALEKEIRRAQRFAAPLSVLLLDLDGLKAINDCAGHAAGDCVVRHCATRIAAVLRHFDGAARVGGDEFVVMLPATNLAGAQQVARRLLQSLDDNAAAFRGRALPITASIGAAEWRPGWDAQHLLEAADQAMYAAKAAGRNSIVTHTAELIPAVPSPASLPNPRVGAAVSPDPPVRA